VTSIELTSGRYTLHHVPHQRQASEPGVPALQLNTTRPGPGTVVVTVRGELDLCTAPRLSDLLSCRLRGTIRRLVVDLSEVDFLGAAGLSVLTKAYLQSQHQGVRLGVVTGDRRAVLRSLTVTGLDRELPLRKDLPSALPAPGHT
jgi:anti-sigma B factor antagonist